jgi:phosphohistidine phosphatase
MIIYFVRHASAGEHKADPKKDAARGLDEDGIRQCGLMGRALAAVGAQVDYVISSPLKRASQTASLIGNEIGHEGKLKFEHSLRPEATFDEFREMLESYSAAEAILLVGHEPNFSEFLGRLIGGRTAANVEMKKAAAAKLEWNRKSATLSWCITPKVVRSIQEAAALSSRPKSSRK